MIREGWLGSSGARVSSRTTARGAAAGSLGRSVNALKASASEAQNRMP